MARMSPEVQAAVVMSALVFFVSGLSMHDMHFYVSLSEDDPLFSWSSNDEIIFC